MNDSDDMRCPHCKSLGSFILEDDRYGKRFKCIFCGWDDTTPDPEVVGLNPNRNIGVRRTEGYRASRQGTRPSKMREGK